MVTPIPYRERLDPQEFHLVEKVVQIRRVAKVVKGGRHLSFTALVVVGDGQGHVGIGMGKAPAVPGAVRKGTTIARNNLITISMRGHTIPHATLSKYGAAKVLLKPAAPGTGIIAGGAVRAVMEMAGVTDIISKSLGSSNPINIVKAVIQGLVELKDPQEELARRLPEVAARRRARLAAQPASTPVQETPAPAQTIFSPDDTEPPEPEGDAELEATAQLEAHAVPEDDAEVEASAELAAHAEPDDDAEVEASAELAAHAEPDDDAEPEASAEPKDEGQGR